MPRLLSTADSLKIPRLGPLHQRALEDGDESFLRWEMSEYTHFEIPLAVGSRRVRRPPRRRGPEGGG